MQEKGEIYQWGAYRPKHEEEQVDPSHTAEIDGRTFVPVRVYGPKPSITDRSNLVPNTAPINPPMST